jgi:hypothetical protein
MATHCHCWSPLHCPALPGCESDCPATYIIGHAAQRQQAISAFHLCSCDPVGAMEGWLVRAHTSDGRSGERKYDGSVRALRPRRLGGATCGLTSPGPGCPAATAALAPFCRSSAAKKSDQWPVAGLRFTACASQIRRCMRALILNMRGKMNPTHPTPS